MLIPWMDSSPSYIHGFNFITRFNIILQIPFCGPAPLGNVLWFYSRKAQHWTIQGMGAFQGAQREDIANLP